MTNGLYLYCLREPSETAPEIQSAGVDGKGGVFIRAFDGIEAVVSEVKEDVFGEMQKKAQEDVQWIKEKALAHEMVVEEAMGLSANDSIDRNSKSARLPARNAAHSVAGGSFRAQRGISSEDITDKEILRSAQDDNTLIVVPFSVSNSVPVIPVKFGVIFNNEERLAKVINEQHAVIMAAFDRIRAKHEWSVKLYLKDNQKFKDRVRQESEKLSEKSNALAALPAGMAYFMEEEVNQELERECSRRLNEEAMKTFDELKSFAAEATLVKILDSKLTGRSERMVLNSAYLVADSHLPEFGNAVAKLREKFVAHGFLVEQSGPWTPYHFTEFNND